MTGDKVKNFVIAICSTLTFMLVACQSTSPFALPSKTPEPTLTVSPTATQIFIPKVTATPVTASIGTDDELYLLLKKIYPMCPCVGMNYANTSSENAPSELEFIEANIEPDPNHYWVSEIADNISKSHQAFVACDPGFCQDKIYMADNNTHKVYEINWGWRMPSRPIQWVTWINNDSLAFFQSSNSQQGQIIVVDVNKRKYLFAAIVFPDYFCITRTPTP